jgi:uncharacterized protein (TIGR00106 family)
MITAELTIIPIGTPTTSLSSYITAAVEALEKTGVKFELSGMGTLLEAEDSETLFFAIQTAHEAVFNAGAERVATSIKIDERRDQDRTMEDKVLSVRKKL